MKELIVKLDNTLMYLDLHGKGASIRALLTHSKVAFVDKRLSIEQFEKLKASDRFPNG